MKKMVMVLAALCVTGVASALTINWNDGYDGSIWSGGAGWNSIAGEKDNMAHLTLDSGNRQIVVNVGTLVANHGVESLNITRILLLAHGTDGSTVGVEDVTFTLKNAGESDGQEYTASARNAVGTVGGRNVYEFVFDTPITVVEGQTLTLTSESGKGYGVVHPDNDPDGIVGDWSAEWNAGVGITTAAVLPEPTTLALLALGMAGLALRRRVA